MMESIEVESTLTEVGEKTDSQDSLPLFTIVKFGVLAGLLFGAGFWYAKLTTPKSTSSTVASAATSIDTLKEKQAEYEAIQKRLKLSYYEELSSAPRKSSFDPEPASSEKMVAAAAVATPAKTDTKPPPPTPEPVAEKEEALPEPKAPKVEEQKPSSDRMAKALERVLGKETPGSVTSAAKVKLPTQTGSPFAIQVASLPDRKVAEELVNRLSLKGYAARLVQADIPGRGLVYRVRIHGYQTRQDAEAARDALAKKEKLDAITVAQ